mgnify:FL=1
MFNFEKVDALGNFFVSLFQRIALFAIALATIYAAFHGFYDMYTKQIVNVQDLLLMFIYLEIIAMVGVYFNTSRMPVRFVMYIAIAAMTRYLADVVSNHGNSLEILMASGTILVLSLAVLVVKFSSSKFPPGTE